MSVVENGCQETLLHASHAEAIWQPSCVFSGETPPDYEKGNPGMSFLQEGLRKRLPRMKSDHGLTLHE